AVCPLSVARSCPLYASHSLSVLSSPPVARVWPSGLKATQVTLAVCPWRVARSCPLCAPGPGPPGRGPRRDGRPREGPARLPALPAAEPLRADRDLLETIPGVGRRTATAVLAELPAVDRLPSAQVAAAYCGLAPREFRSGASVRRRTRLSKAGNARLRQALFLPTQTAVRFNPLLRGVFGRPVAAGRPRREGVGACLGQLVMLCYGVPKNRPPFAPDGA